MRMRRCCHGRTTNAGNRDGTFCANLFVELRMIYRQVRMAGATGFERGIASPQLGHPTSSVNFANGFPFPTTALNHLASTSKRMSAQPFEPIPTLPSGQLLLTLRMRRQGG